MFFDDLRGIGSPDFDLPNYGIATPTGKCIDAEALVSVPTALDSPVPAVIGTVGAGAPQRFPLATDLKRIAGTNRVQATLTTVGADARAFFAISAGTSRRTPASSRTT